MATKKTNVKIIKPQTLKGFRDFLPEDAIKRQYVTDKIRSVFERYGYDPVETPVLEYLDIFKGQIGEDEKLFYHFTDYGGREVALRYDQTVPTCRVIAQYKQQLGLPFKRYQIQLVWRAEKPQKGRYREFLQCDADIFGVKSPEADAETIALSMDIYKELGFKEIITRINDRSLYKGIPYPVIASIDKLKKIGRLEVIKEIVKKGYKEKEAENLLIRVTNFKPNTTIDTIFSYLKNTGFPKTWFTFDPTLARSFSYSTGPIWEIDIPGFDAGSVLGGERYDNLVRTFAKTDVPGTGFAVGFDRTVEAMEQFGLLPKFLTNAKILITVFSKDLLSSSIRLAAKLRSKGINTDIFPDPTVKLEKQLKYADKKGIRFAAILGPDEAKKEKITLKDLHDGTQDLLSFNECLSKLTHGL